MDGGGWRQHRKPGEQIAIDAETVDADARRGKDLLRTVAIEIPCHRFAEKRDGLVMYGRRHGKASGS